MESKLSPETAHIVQGDESTEECCHPSRLTALTNIYFELVLFINKVIEQGPIIN